MRNPREEAAARVGHRWDVRVLEPSPPAVTAPPWFADDPVEGGEVVPVDRPGARSWASVCDEEPELRPWCEDRWLVRGSLRPLPRSYAETRDILHKVAEEVIAPARERVTGKIGLRFTYHGFGTPLFGDGRQLRVEDGVLFDESGAAEPLAVDRDAARALGDWYGFCASLLEQMRADADHDDAPGRVQLWPEHFDLAVHIGGDGQRANYGGSPGDEFHAAPYLYVGPWEMAGRTEPFWNAPFGAILGYADILAGADPLAFLRRGKAVIELSSR